MLPDGFELLKRWCNPQIGDAAFAEHTWRQPAIRLFGRYVQVPRLTAWYGSCSYTYSGCRNEPAPMPVWLDELRREIEAHTGARFNSVLLNLYRDGKDSVSWHADDEPELGEEPTIASLSFGAARRFLVKNKLTKETTSLLLEDGDLLVMQGRSQKDFLHSVPKMRNVSHPRINLTFRFVG